MTSDAETTVSRPRWFPIMGVKFDRHRPGIPWHLMEACEKQALHNHQQTVARLAERGGLHPAEALAVLEGHPYVAMPFAEAERRLRQVVAERMPDDRASKAEERLTHLEEALRTIPEAIRRVSQRVAELPDRTSPDDWPEAMLVTATELESILSEELEASLTSRVKT